MMGGTGSVNVSTKRKRLCVTRGGEKVFQRVNLEIILFHTDGDCVYLNKATLSSEL